VLGGRGGAIPTGVSIGLQPSTAALVERVAEEVAAGYRRVKIKIKPGHDRELVEAVRARFPELPLMVDANSAYTLADAPLFQEMDRHALMMAEQPLAWDDVVDHAALQRLIRTPVCLDESIHSAEDARRALQLGACRIVNIKAGRVGGFSGSLAVHDVCRAASVPVWCGGMLESGIGRLANVHLQTLPASRCRATRRPARATSRRTSSTAGHRLARGRSTCRGPGHRPRIDVAPRREEPQPS
jgi:O-succinylbenzoate synthase